MKKSILTLLCTALALHLASCGTPAAEQTETEAVPTTLAETAAEVAETETATTTMTKTTSEITETTTEMVTETKKVCACESDFQHAC